MTWEMARLWPEPFHPDTSPLASTIYWCRWKINLSETPVPLCTLPCNLLTYQDLAIIYKARNMHCKLPLISTAQSSARFNHLHSSMRSEMEMLLWITQCRQQFPLDGNQGNKLLVALKREFITQQSICRTCIFHRRELLTFSFVLSR